MSIVVYTSVLGGFDNLRPPLCKPEPGVRYICFTDCPVLPSVEPWEFRPVHRVEQVGRVPLGPNHGLEFACGIDGPRTSRLPKILPHLVLPADCDYSIWHDGNFQMKASPSETVAKLLRTADWAAHKHPGRDCIYQEAEVLLSEKIGTAALVERQIDRARDVYGHPKHFGLWANGFIVRRHNAATVALNERWWDLFISGCERDQISFPVALRQSGVGIETIRHTDIYGSEFVKFNWHAAFKAREDNPTFWPERARIAERVRKLQEIAGPGGYSWAKY